MNKYAIRDTRTTKIVKTGFETKQETIWTDIV